MEWTYDPRHNGKTVTNIRTELHELKAAASAEAATTAIKLLEGIQQWRVDPMASCGFSELEIRAARVLTLLGQVRAFAQADSLLDND